MSKVTLSDVTSGYASAAAVNANNEVIEVAFDNTISRDGTGPNHMNANIDMNGYSIINLGNPITVSGWSWEGPWVTSTSYTVGDVVENNGSAYICIVAHTSGTFATDLSNLKWQLVAQANMPSQTGHAGALLKTNGTSVEWQDTSSTIQSVLSAANVSALKSILNIGIINVRDYGAVGDGTTDDTSAIQSAITAAGGKTIYFPQGTYVINSNISKPSTGVSLITDAGVEFTGTGRMFAFDSNSYHDYIGTTFTKNYDETGVAGRGYSALSSEFQATDGFLGNGCAAFFGTKTPNNAVGFYWSINPILQLNPGLTGNGIACEVDLDNFTADGKGQGVLVTGVGNYSSQVGLAIQRGDTTSDWQYGQWIKNSEIGLQIDGATVGSPSYGLSIVNYPNNLIKLRPSNDTTPADAMMFVSNAADTQVNWKVTKRGGIVIGNSGTEITKHLSASAVLNFGSVAAHSTSELTITVTGAAVGDVCYASPNLSLTSGFVWSAYCATANTVTVRVLNGTAGALDPDGAGGATWRADVWKH